jgi:CIC family chloride channel protein
MLGGAVGGIERHFWGAHLTGSTGTYALVGMGVLFAGFLRAPMTSVFMVLEVSGEYSIIVPVIIANTVAYVLSRGLQPVPIFDLLSRQDGLDLPSMEEQREENILRIEDAMRQLDGPVLDSRESVQQANQRIQQAASDIFLVRFSPTGWRSATRQLLQTSLSEGKAELSLGSILSAQPLPVLHPDLPLDVALRYVNQTDVVPVVSRADFGKLEGVISSEDVLSRYRR